MLQHQHHLQQQQAMAASAAALGQVNYQQSFDIILDFMKNVFLVSNTLQKRFLFNNIHDFYFRLLPLKHIFSHKLTKAKNR
jgi:hypothetical protein